MPTKIERISLIFWSSAALQINNYSLLAWGELNVYY